MATARNTPAPEEGDTQTSGLSEDDRNWIKSAIAEAVGGVKPPEGSTPTAPKVSDDEWDKMSDRQRESWVRSLVDFELEELIRYDADAKLRADVEALKQKPEPEPEAPPSVVSRLQKFLWGDPQEKP
jgi:hypothetical protein